MYLSLYIYIYIYIYILEPRTRALRARELRFCLGAEIIDQITVQITESWSKGSIKIDPRRNQFSRESQNSKRSPRRFSQETQTSAAREV